jgi:hypothetical protein
VINVFYILRAYSSNKDKWLIVRLHGVESFKTNIRVIYIYIYKQKTCQAAEPGSGAAGYVLASHSAVCSQQWVLRVTQRKKISP